MLWNRPLCRLFHLTLPIFSVCYELIYICVNLISRMVSQCSFNLHWSPCEWRWGYFHTVISFAHLFYQVIIFFLIDLQELFIIGQINLLGYGLQICFSVCHLSILSWVVWIILIFKKFLIIQIYQFFLFLTFMFML